MTDISQIDGGRTGQAAVPQRQASRDFSEELARDHRMHEFDNRSDRAAEAPSLSADTVQPAANTQGESTAALQLALMGASETSATIRLLQQMAVQPIGQLGAVRNARVFGVHLLAGAYLSEVDTAETGGTAGDVNGGAPKVVDPSGQVALTSAEAKASVAALSAVPSTDVQAQASPAISGTVAVALSSHGNAALDNVAHGVAGAGTLAHWVDRLLRYSRQPDGSTVAWLRDFRVSEDQVPALVSAVLQHASQLGMTPGLIMLNGREVWPSTHNTQGE